MRFFRRRRDWWALVVVGVSNGLWKTDAVLTADTAFDLQTVARGRRKILLQLFGRDGVRNLMLVFLASCAD